MSSERPPARPSFATVLDTLRRLHGRPIAPVSTDPFHLILWEQVAYLAPYDRRLAAYRLLESTVGLTPSRILKASDAALRKVTRTGGAIAATDRARRIQTSAKLVRDKWDGDLSPALSLPLPQARKALSAFPMIGAPGADRILAITGAHAVFSLDSNGLRVMQRLGWGETSANYNSDYRSVQAAVANELPKRAAQLVEASALQRVHGETICRRTKPNCAACPLTDTCAYFIALASDK
jgi:endonuclease III